MCPVSVETRPAFFSISNTSLGSFNVLNKQALDVSDCCWKVIKAAIICNHERRRRTRADNWGQSVGVHTAGWAGGKEGDARTWWGDAETRASSRTPTSSGRRKRRKLWTPSSSSREERFQAICNIYGAIAIARAIIFCQWTLPENTGQRSNLTPEMVTEAHQVAK